MGTWGHGLFEDDYALDFMADIEESHDPKQLIKNTFNIAINSNYLESDEGTAVTVAAAYVDRQVNGTRFSPATYDEPYEVDTFPERHPNIDLTNLKAKAFQALQKVLNENSELNELWAETGDDYETWRQGMEQLLGRLQ